MTRPVPCTCHSSTVAETFARLVEGKPPLCMVHPDHREDPDPGASDAPALNSPALEASLAAALGAQIHNTTN